MANHDSDLRKAVSDLRETVRRRKMVAVDHRSKKGGSEGGPDKRRTNANGYPAEAEHS